MTRRHYDEDAYAPVGTPFNPLETEEDVHRAKVRKDKEHYVLDEQGRRRFHGAFTGGFSAGYYNTVGSKEGWTPSTFRSSRDSKSEFSRQKPEDFMDAEDLGAHGIAPRQVSTRPNFEQRHGNRGEGGGRDDRMGGAKRHNEAQYSVIPGEAPLQNLIIPARTSIGAQLLRKMGWREGQGVGPRIQRSTSSEGKVYGCSLPSNTSSAISTLTSTTPDDLPTEARGFSFAPRDVNLRHYEGKDDLHGIGYRGMEEREVLGRREVKKAVHGMRGEAFGLGALEEDDDVEDNVYAEESMTSYDVTIAGDREIQMERNFNWTGGVEDSWSLESFTKSNKTVSKTKVFMAPEVPRDFVPIHRFSILNIQSAGGATKPEKPVGVAERNQLLADSPGSVFSLLSAADRERLRRAAGTVTTPASSTPQTPPTAPSTDKPHPPAPPISSSSTEQPTEFPPGLYVPSSSAAPLQQQPSSSSSSLGDTAIDSIKPFSSNPLKQARYEAFLSGRRCPTDRESIGMTEWERQKERDEFSRMKRVYQPLSVSLSTRFTREASKSDQKEKSPEPDSVQAARADMFGALTREVLEWHPHPVLCKRFNVPDPYPNDGLVGTVTAKQKESSSTRTIQFLNVEKPSSVGGTGNIPEGKDPARQPTLPTSSKLDPQELVPKYDNYPEEVEEMKKVQSEGGDEEKEEARPPMDLFKAIFAESSSSESDSEAQEEEEEKATYPEPIPAQTQREITAANGGNGHGDKASEPGRKRRWQDLSSVANKPMVTTADLNNTTTTRGDSEMAGQSSIRHTAAFTNKKSILNGAEESPEEKKQLFGPALPPGFSSVGEKEDHEKEKEEEEVKKERTEEREKGHRHKYHHKAHSSSSSRKEKRRKHISSDEETQRHNHKKKKDKKRSKHKHHYS